MLNLKSFYTSLVLHCSFGYIAALEGLAEPKTLLKPEYCVLRSSDGKLHRAHTQSSGAAAQPCKRFKNGPLKGRFKALVETVDSHFLHFLFC